MIIIHFAEYASGGVATYLRNTIHAQIENPKISKIILFCSDTRSEQFDIKSTKILVVRYKYNRSFTGVFQLLNMVKKALKMNPDIIHFHSTFSGLGRLLVKEKRNFAVFYSSHGWAFLRQSDGKLKHRIYAKIEKILAIKTDKIVNISKYENTAALKYGFSKQKMLVIYNSIPPKVKSDVDIKSPFLLKDTIKLGFVGRLDSPKGFPFLKKALKSVDIPFELMVIGENVVDDIPMTISDEKRFHYMGWISHDRVDSYFQFIDFLVVPSLWEGFGLVALESMKNSKPVLSSDAGGLPEIVNNGINGFVFKSLSVQSFVEKFNQMVNSDMETLGKNGYITMTEKFDYQKLQDKLFNEYEKEVRKRNAK